MLPRIVSLCSYIFLVLRVNEFHSCAMRRQWCGIFHNHWWSDSIKPRLLFTHAGLQAMLPEGLFFSVEFNLLQLVCCVCAAGVKYRPVLHLFVVICFWSSGIMDCMLLTFENSAHALVVWCGSVVWHLSLPRMKSFNNTQAAVFPCMLCFIKAFAFLSWI